MTRSFSLPLATVLLLGGVILCNGCGKSEYDRRLDDSITRLASANPSDEESDVVPSDDELQLEDEINQLGAGTQANRQDNDDGNEDSNNAGSSRPPRRNTGGGGGVIGGVRGAVSRSGGQQGMRQVAQALLNYQSQQGSFPPRYIKTRDGSPGLSWRVLILPYLDQGPLYGRFQEDEPWDSEHNQALISRMPKVYDSTGSLPEGKTVILAVGGSDSVIAEDQVRMNQVRDGTSNTAMFVEANEEQAVFWTQPSDYEWTAQDPSAGLGGVRGGIFLIGMADGRIVSGLANASASDLASLFMKADGNVVSLDDVLAQ